MLIPFGLTIASATFQCLLNSIFSSFLGDFLTVYLGDLLVHSASKLEHLAYLWTVFEQFYTH